MPVRLRIGRSLVGGTRRPRDAHGSRPGNDESPSSGCPSSARTYCSAPSSSRRRKTRSATWPLKLGKRWKISSTNRTQLILDMPPFVTGRQAIRWPYFLLLILHHSRKVIYHILFEHCKVCFSFIVNLSLQS